MVYTTASAFMEALWEAGVLYCFVNLGSDHPSLIEAIVKGQKENQERFPTIITCPNEMVALSMADGFARLTGKPQCVIVHVDVGTQALGQAIHNASTGRAPVLIFAGLSPYTIEAEHPGSRMEYIHWMQDVPDQRQIVAQYCRYTAEIKTGKNVKQMVNRALQFATSDPQGPVYLVGAREVMAQEIEPYHLDQNLWHPVRPPPLPEDGVEQVASLLVRAEKPLVIVGYSGRNKAAATALIDLADIITGLRVLDTGGSDMSFPFTHPASLGMRFGFDPYVTQADAILVVDCDVPWVPTRCRPRLDARIVHIDSDPLKNQMPVFYLPAEARFRADSATALTQLCRFLKEHPAYSKILATQQFEARHMSRLSSHSERLEAISKLAIPREDGNLTTSYVAAQVKRSCPADTIWCIEAVTQSFAVSDQLQVDLAKSWINCGGGGLGWSGGGSLGVKLATDIEHGGPGKGKFVCQIVGDGSFLFSVPASVYWISRRYDIPTLTIVLNNKGWNAPRHSLMLVHPEGEASKVPNEELHISFEPSPDYPGIAKAASGGKLWAGTASTVEQLEDLLPQAIKSVRGGTGAVLEVRVVGMPGIMSKTTQAGRANL